MISQISFLLCLLCLVQGSQLIAMSLPNALEIHLEAPIYNDGVLKTSSGGTIQGEGLRLQAKHITYIKRQEGSIPIHRVIAEGDILFDYYGQIFLADKIEYDFVLKQGFLKNGKTAYPPWYIKAQKVYFHPDRSMDLYQCSLTTSDDEDVALEMETEKLHLKLDSHFSTYNMRFKCYKVPIFWVPYFKASLKKEVDPAIKYALSWDAGQGPKISMRYKVYGWDRFNIYLRGDYRYARGPGGALEMDYASEDHKTIFQSKNYAAHDTFFNDDNPDRKRTRFRLQGLYKKVSADNNGRLHVVFDKISDKNMPLDFPVDDFELSTQKQTFLKADYVKDPYYIASLHLRPRLNSFQGLNQELPHFKMQIKPLSVGNTGLLLENDFDLAYFNYVYSNELTNVPPALETALQEFDAVRAQTKQTLSLPLKSRYLEFTPSAGLIGIAYNDSPNNESIYQGIVQYGARMQTHLYKRFSKIRHRLSPYIVYQGIYHPLHQLNQVYIFNLQDGFHSINALKVGLHNLFYHSHPTLPSFTCDLYALGFLGDQTFRIPFPKAGVDFSAEKSNLRFDLFLRWNFNNHVLDFGNAIFSYTLSSYAAFQLEYRYRSAYDWRKGDHENFILDVSRPIDDLFFSPLSDRRQTAIAKMEFRPHPKWICQAQLHGGWGRDSEPGYTEAKLDLITYLSSSWKLKISYMYTARGTSHFGLRLDLVSKKN